MTLILNCLLCKINSDTITITILKKDLKKHFQKTEIWGEELNKKPKEECTKENTCKDVTKSAKQLSAAMQSIASKLRSNTSAFKVMYTEIVQQAIVTKIDSNKKE